MSQIVHIKFEKLTGLQGDIEGDFLVSGYFDFRLPIVFVYHVDHIGSFFTQNDHIFIIRPISGMQNYGEHFEYGMNLLVKEACAYGSGVDTGSKNPN